MSEQLQMTSFLCIGCPLGCRLEVEADEEDVVAVRGFRCKTGVEFAHQEHRHPVRNVATTVKAHGGMWARLPVKTDKPIPKAMALQIADAIHRIQVQAPVRVGDVVLANVLDTGANIVATRDLQAGSH